MSGFHPGPQPAPKPPLVGVYRHYKNCKLYLVLGTAHDQTGDGEPEVVYRALYKPDDGKVVHRRTVQNFTETARVDGGVSIPRFTPVHRRVWSTELFAEHSDLANMYMLYYAMDGGEVDHGSL